MPARISLAGFALLATLTAGCGGEDRAARNDAEAARAELMALKAETERARADLEQSRQKIQRAQEAADKVLAELKEKKAGHEVRGMVTLNGKPLPAGRVVLLTDTGVGRAGWVNAEGRYVIPNVPVGEYTVTVHARGANPAVPIPPQYTDVTASGIRFHVKGDTDQPYDIHLAGK